MRKGSGEDAAPCRPVARTLSGGPVALGLSCREGIVPFELVHALLDPLTQRACPTAGWGRDGVLDAQKKPLAGEPGGALLLRFGGVSPASAEIPGLGLLAESGDRLVGVGHTVCVSAGADVGQAVKVHGGLEDRAAHGVTDDGLHR